MYRPYVVLGHEEPFATVARIVEKVGEGPTVGFYAVRRPGAVPADHAVGGHEAGQPELGHDLDDA